MTAPADLGRAIADLIKVLPDGFDFTLTRRASGHWYAIATNGLERRWCEAPDPVAACEGLQDQLIAEMAEGV